MNIKKIGHCCLVIETSGFKVMTDPGTFTTEQGSETGIDVILITHEHADHLHVESLQKVLANNPNATVMTNSSVSKLLSEKDITHEILEGTSEKIFGLTSVTGDASEANGSMKSIFVRAHDAKHDEIFEAFGQVQNTGYFIGNNDRRPGGSDNSHGDSSVEGAENAGVLFYPGDSFANPPQPGTVGILALPVAGPWCKVPDAIRYALAVRPKKAFPVHDGQLVLDRIGGYHAVPHRILAENGIEFVPMMEGDEKKF